jgi:DNA-binding transcriptional MerR regulator
MRRLGIGEVCRLLDIKPHILRYWEEEISFLEPEKNTGGRRMYGDSELNLLYRLKYLIVEKRLTVEGAKLALLDEMSGPRGNEKAEILAQRKNLLDSLEGLDRLKEKTSDLIGSSFIPSGQEHLREIWKDLPMRKRRNLSFDLLRLPQHLFTLLAALHEAAPANVPSRGLELVSRKNIPGGFDEAEECLASRKFALLTIAPDIPGAALKDIAAALLRLAKAVKEGSKPYGKIPLWYIFTAPRIKEEPAPASLRSILCEDDSLFFDEEQILFLKQPFFPYLDRQGRLLMDGDGHIAGYASGMAGVLLVMSSPAFQRGLAARGGAVLGMLPLNRFSLNFPDRELLAGHFLRKADLSVLCAAENGDSGGTAYRTTGNYILRSGFLSSCNPAFYFSPAVIPAENSADELEERPYGKIQASLSSCAQEAAVVWGMYEGV